MRKIEKDGLHQFKKITVENGIGEATFDALYDNNGNRQKSIETGEYEAVLAIARPDQNPNVEGQNQNNWDTNNALSEVDNGQTFDYQFTIAINDRYTVDSSHDTVVISATQMGNNSISYTDIKDGLKDASQFMVVANYFEQSMHFEGNFAVDKFKGNGNPVGAQGTEKKINLTINIEKSVNPAAAKTFNFRIVDANKNKVADVTITTDANGVGSTSYTIKDAKSAYEVYELDEKGNILEDGGKIGDYTVSYDYSEGLKGLMNYDTTSFAKVIEGVTSLTANSSNNLFVTTSEVTTDKGAVKKVTAAEFDSLINITNILTTVSGLSKKLAKAKSTDSAQVVYLTPSDLKQHRLNLPAVTDNQALVINVMIPSGMNELDVATEVLYVGNEIVDVAGKKESELDPNSKGQQIAKRTIWNFVNEDGTPYKGYVKDAGKKMGGFALVPEGSYMNNNGMCSIYAKNVYQGGAEIHKNSFPGDQEKSGTVKISNSTEAPEKIDISGTKTWDDADNQDGKRPSSIIVKLLADGELKETKTVTEDDGWNYSFTGLDKFKDGNLINYTVEEEKVEGYTSAVEGYDITNSYTPGKTSVKVTKAWNDSNDQDGLRPNEIKVQLKADGEPYGKEESLNAENGWSHTWDDLDEKKAGTEIVYTVEEVGEVTGYTAEVSGTAKDGFKITNSHTPEKIGISGTKTWNDSDDQDGKRPSSIIVRLLADGELRDTKTVTAENNWSYSFTGLDKYKNGNLITYTVEENAVEGYTSSVEGYDITNSYTPGKTSVKVTKVWNDSNDQDGLRPNEIKVQLKADGEPYGKEESLNAENGWSHTWDDLDEKKAGTEIVYTVEEVGEVTGYTAEVSGTAKDGFKITNSHTPEKIGISGTKTWNDSDDQDGKRPSSIIVKLLADGELKETKTVTEDDGWNYSFTGLDKFKDGNLINYTVEEEKVEGYTSAVEGYDITNSYTPGKTSVKVTKAWNDSNDQDGLRPNEIKVQLKADGEPYGKEESLNAENGWSHTWDDLDEKKAGTEIVYTVEEVGEVTGYTAEVSGTAKDGFKITNSHTPEKIGISGTKTWNDSDDQDGKRPSSIIVRLLADGELRDTKTVTAENNWSYSFTGLDKYKNGNLITYTVEENAVEGYTSSVDGYDITNSYTPGKTSVKVTKAWNDSNDQDGLRPNEIKVQLKADGEPYGKEESLNAENGWSHTWDDLDEKKAGTEIVYTVEEVGEVTGYTAEVSGTAKDGFKITNSHTPEKIGISGTKTWNDSDDQDGKRPSSIIVRLLADGELRDTKTVTAENNWSYSFTGLDKYKNGNLITYTVEENAVEGYTSSVDGYDITNSYTPGKTSVKVTKAWNDSNDQDGLRPNEIKVQLKADGEPYGKEESLNAENGWSHTWDDLDEKKAGTEIVYTVEEVGEVTGYTAEVSGTAKDGFKITNSHTPEKIGISGTKTWNDSDDQDGKRPSSIIVRLLADGELRDTKTVTAENNWSYSFTGLDKYKNGNLITYTVEENAVEGYTSSVEGYDITNSYTPGKTSVKVTKVWNDSNDQDGLRPNEIKVQLKADGEPYGKEESLNAENGWSHTWDDLDEKKAGTEIVYTVEEVGEVTGYTAEVSGTAKDGFKITNSHTPEKIGISGTKTWNDSDDQDGKRPSSIIVRLLADGELRDTKTVTAENNWSYSFTGLDKYKNGNLITYTVEENAVEGYTSSVDGYDITNSYTPGKTSATVAKIWADVENQDGKRPESITVSLLADGKATGTTVILNAENDWTQTVSDLPEKADGKAIEYTWKEETLPEGYKLTDTSKNGTVTTLTNTYAPEKVSITGTKTWNDANNQDGKRPTSIKINLLANGNVVKSLDVTAATNWTYSFTDLPKYEAGTEIKYTVREEAVADYETKVEGYNITNTHKPATLDITGTKTWNDSNNQDGKRPKSITVNLLANGIITDTKNVTADDNWTYSFTDLPKYANGQEITYTVSELTVPGYTTTIDDNYNITNSYTPGETSASVTKIWDDADNQDGKRPESITVALLANGTPTNKTVTLTAANNWTQTITGLPEKADGEYITYTWTEVNVPEGYSLTRTSKNETVTTLTNTHTPELTSITGTKTWKDADNQDGKRPESITVNLFADGTKLKSQNVSANADGNWSLQLHRPSEVCQRTGNHLHRN